MSTPALIFVHVRPSDKGKIRKCDTTKIHLRTYEDVKKIVTTFNPNLKGKKLSLRINDEVKYDILTTPEELDKRLHGIKLPEYLCIYHHWDGQPCSLGKELKKNYSTYENVLNLTLAGDFSTIMDGSLPYMRDNRRTWEENKPRKFDKIYDSFRMSYDYLFDNGKWYIRCFGEKEFKEF